MMIWFVLSDWMYNDEMLWDVLTLMGGDGVSLHWEPVTWDYTTVSNN